VSETTLEWLYFKGDLRQAAVLRTNVLAHLNERHVVELGTLPFNLIESWRTALARRPYVAGYLVALESGVLPRRLWFPLATLLRRRKPVFLHWPAEFAVERLTSHRLRIYIVHWMALRAIGGLIRLKRGARSAVRVAMRGIRAAGRGIARTAVLARQGIVASILGLASVGGFAAHAAGRATVATGRAITRIARGLWRGTSIARLFTLRGLHALGERLARALRRGLRSTTIALQVLRLWCREACLRGGRAAAGSLTGAANPLRRFFGRFSPRDARETPAAPGSLAGDDRLPLVPSVEQKPPEPAGPAAIVSEVAELRAACAPVAAPRGLVEAGGRFRVKGTGFYLRTDFWAPIASGGSYGHTVYVAKHLARSSDDLVCIMSNPFSMLDAMGIKQAPLQLPFKDGAEETIASATPEFYPRIESLVAMFKPAYIYERICLGNYVGAKLSQRYQIPYIVEYNGSEISMMKSFAGRGYRYEALYLAVEDLAFAQASLISVISENVKESLVARGIPAAKILVNPNCADPEDFVPAAPEERLEIRRSLGFEPEHRVVGFTGTFGGWHGIDVLAESLPRILSHAPDIRFLLIGDGNNRRLIDQVILREKLTERVVMTGRVPQAAGRELLKACDIYVSPHSSHMVDGKFFGSPTKIFEYMALGRGIVASDLEQIGEVLQPALRGRDLRGRDLRSGRDPEVISERSILCRPGDVGEFSEAVCYLLDRPEVAARLGSNARRAVETVYNWDHHVQAVWRRLRYPAGSSEEAPAARTTGERDDESRHPDAASAGSVERNGNGNGHTTGAALGQGNGAAALVESTRNAETKAGGSLEHYKRQAQAQWDRDPCGSHYVKDKAVHGTLAWFKEAERYRHEVYAPWMREVMEFDRHRGKEVLEIGGGMGTDLAQFAAAGSFVTDLDLSEGHLRLARENFRLRGLQGSFLHGDAESLPFPDSSFDVVYSNGVLHHIPDTQRVIEEIHRVLRPGGKAIIMVYALWSLHYWYRLFYKIGIESGELKRRSMHEIMSRSVELSEAGSRPLVKVYTTKELKRMFGGFIGLKICRRQMVQEELQVFPLLRTLTAGWVGRFLGWNLVLKAVKPIAGRQAAA